MSEVSDEPPTKSTRSDLYRPPTNEELADLHETEVLFHSNLVKLQIKETLHEVSISEKKCSQINDFLHLLHDCVMSTPKTESTLVQSMSWLGKSVAYPFVRVPRKVKGTIVFLPPCEIKLVGSYQLNTFLKQRVNVDLLVIMPKECMQAKDHLNQRYLRKRALYLAHIAEHFSSNEIIGDIKFSYFLENPLKPVVLLTPAGPLQTLVSVQLHACPEDGSLKVDRFLPTVSNVRRYWYNGCDYKEEEETLFPTPHYNSCVLMDLLMEKHLCFLYELFNNVQAYKDAVKLLKVWLHQRDFDSGYGCFSGFLMSMLIAYLVSSKKINKFMSSYQIARNVFKFLSTSDWTKSGLSFDSSVDLTVFHQNFEVVFVDPCGKLNLCAAMPAALYHHVTHEAKLSLAALDNQDGFSAVFMQFVSFAMKFDQLMHVVNAAAFKKSAKKLQLEEKLVDCASNCIVATLPYLTSVLQKGLGERVHLLGIRTHTYESWDIGQHPPTWKEISRPITLALLVNRHNSTDVLEKGPVADAAEASDFRQFWGDKSELRRFQDGAICEAVLWKASSMMEQRDIPLKICKYLLSRHLDILPTSTLAVGSQLEGHLIMPRRLLKDGYVAGYVGTGDEVHQEAILCFNKLCQKIRGLSLPLTVTSIQGISPIVRGTEVFPCRSGISHVLESALVGGKRLQVPVPSKVCPKYALAIEAICHLEGSGKWPQDAGGVRRLKAAFHATICDELQKRNSNLLCVPSPDHLVVFDQGFAFRVSVAYNREVVVLQTSKTPDGMVKICSNPESLALEKRIVKLPLLAGMLNGLAQTNPAFGETCRLAKRWVNSQLLSGHITPEAVELLVASLFTNLLPGISPGSCQAGFLRFLHFVSSFDFAANPVIVDIRKSFSKSDLESVVSTFTENRHSLPDMCIVTPDDRLGSSWTGEKPSKVVLRRLQDLAKLCLQQANATLLSGKALNITAFTPSLKAYDVVIHLKSNSMSKRHQNVAHHKTGFGNSETTENEIVPNLLPVLDFEPVQRYLHELEGSFADLAMFFHDADGGTVIGVLWRPNAFDAKQFKIGLAEHVALLQNGECAADVHAILEDFGLLGCGLVDCIETRTEKWKI